jgi:hypothetical protein
MWGSDRDYFRLRHWKYYREDFGDAGRIDADGDDWQQGTEADLANGMQKACDFIDGS